MRATLRFAAAGCALAVSLAGCGGASYTVMQMNLCLSGLAGCFARTAYPAVLDEAVARIRAAHPDAVTVNEACRDDMATIARRAGYHLRFSRVVYRGRPLRCVRPAGRGLFGDAVLTRAPIERADGRAFSAQEGIERRRWVCATTRDDVDVCTAHLNTRAGGERAGNDAQCAELRAILARRAATRSVVFAGDVNRQGSCAPRGLWTESDRAAGQAAGIQHVYGSRALGSPAAHVIGFTHSDHDVLVVRAG